MNADDLFVAALDISDPAERHAYLERVCAGDEPLRRELESLLAAYERIGEFLGKRPTLVAGSTEVAPRVETVSEKAGDRIGRYHLLEPIGEGGFGVVWMAEQEEPVRRRVALKIIKLGMDTRSVVVRFEAERQALALMDHPNIAQVFDGGATDAGRPFFVMELVKGVPITNYCEERKLSTRARLELVVQVCRAVQHAHQKGVIHRDLKPSNILVTEQDGRPLPKVIDFGIAKATGVRLTDKTLFTGFQQWLGTLSYMSPEQAGLGSLDVDTRSDTYSLGVVLYELLTGRTPFDTQALLKDGYEAVLRTIREVDPPKPSTRLTELVEADVRRLTAKPDGREPKAETNRAIQRLLQKKKELLQNMRGDLDWIVMKCLEKDRNRRYETANSLALDLERYLHEEPVMARPPSASYRWGKFARKHRGSVSAAAAFILLLSMATGVSTALALWANRERAKAGRAMEAETAQRHTAEKERTRAVEAEQQQSTLRQQAESSAQKATTESTKSRQVAQFLTSMLEGVGPNVALGRNTTLLREILDKTATRLDEELKGQPDVELQMRETLGKVYLQLGAFPEAEAMSRRNLRLAREMSGPEHPDVVAALDNLGLVLERRGSYVEAESIFREALMLAERFPGSQKLITALANLASALQTRSRFGEAEKLYLRAITLAESSKTSDERMASILNDLSMLQKQRGQLVDAEKNQRRVVAILKTLHGNEHPDVANSLHNLASIVERGGDLLQALELYRQAVNQREKFLPANHPHLAGSLNNLGYVLQGLGRLEESEDLHRRALAMRRAFYGQDHRDVAASLDDLGTVMERRGRLEEAERLYTEALNARRGLLGEGHSDVGESLYRLARLYQAQGQPAKAESCYRQILPIWEKVYDGEPQRLAKVLNSLGLVLQRQRKLDDAKTYFERALAKSREGQPRDLSTEASMLNNLAGLLRLQGDSSQAETRARDSLSLITQAQGPAHDNVANVQLTLGRILLAQKKAEEAESLLRGALQADSKNKGSRFSFLLQADLGNALVAQKKYGEAETLLGQAFDGLARQGSSTTSTDSRSQVKDVMRSFVQLYEGWDKPEQAAAWRQRLDRLSHPVESNPP